MLYNKQFTLFCLKKANLSNKLTFTTTNLHYNVMFAYGEYGQRNSQHYVVLVSLYNTTTPLTLLAVQHYDALDLEGWAAGVAVTVTSTIVQASRWDTP